MLKTVFRVVNEDVSTHDKKDIIDGFDTLEEAMQCSIDNYFFNTSIEQWVVSNWEWKQIAVNGTMCN